MEGQGLFNLVADALAARVDAVVGVHAGVGSGEEDVEGGGGVRGAQGFGDGEHVGWVSPEL